MLSPLLVLLLLYSVGQIALGVWMGRHVRGTSDFFVGGRSLGPGLIFATFLAPNIGAAAAVGATALAYEHGLSAWWWNGSSGIGSLILAFWVGPKIWREAKRLNLLTVGDFLEHRFGRGVRGVTAALLWMGTLFVLCAQLDGAATVLQVAGGLPHWAGCLVGTIVMTGYFITGGLASAARVNTIQLAVKMAGFLLAVPIAIAAAGGSSAVLASNASRMNFFDGSSVGTGWPLLFLIAPAFFLSPGLLQKAFSARDERALTRGVALNGLALVAFSCLPIALGMTARILYPDLVGTQQQLALASVLTNHLPFFAAALALAAVFSAEMSAADAVLYMLSTSGARDLYKGYVKPDASDTEVLRAARIAALVGAALAYGLTFIYPNVLDALKMFYSVLVVSLFAPLLGGLYLPAAGRRAALPAMLAGVGVLLVMHTITGGKGYGWVSPTLLGLIASGATYVVAGFSRPRSG
jgi:SSS family solute:Na+ symporter